MAGYLAGGLAASGWREVVGGSGWREVIGGKWLAGSGWREVVAGTEAWG